MIAGWCPWDSGSTVGGRPWVEQAKPSHGRGIRELPGAATFLGQTLRGRVAIFHDGERLASPTVRIAK